MLDCAYVYMCVCVCVCVVGVYETRLANTAGTLFKLLANYRPETAKEKKDRLIASAKAEVKNAAQDKEKKPKMIKFGLNHITSLVESKKAKLVVIAHDVDPLELVVWLPTLCRKMDVPYVIVKGKARLGALVHQKNAAALAVTEVCVWVWGCGMGVAVCLSPVGRSVGRSVWLVYVCMYGCMYVCMLF
jgi:ribosomal protein L7Ae-like RNA K-turn-binding protein